MNASRRDAGSVEANAGTIASSRGRETVAPRPRRMNRRLSGLFMGGANHDLFGELSEGLVTSSRGPGGFPAQRIGCEFGGKAAGEPVLIAEQKLLQGFGPFA